MLSVIKLRLLRLRDEYLVFVLMTAMALGLTFVFGTSMGGGYQSTVLVVDEDGSRYSEMLSSVFTSQPGFIFEKAGYGDAVKAVESGSALTAIVIPEGFEAAVKGGKQAAVGVIKVRDDMDILALERLVAGGAAKMMGSIRIAGIAADFAGGKGNADRQALEDQAYRDVMDAWQYRNPMTVSGETVDVGKDSGDASMKRAMIGFSVFFSMYTMVFGVGTILYDKKHRLWQRMLISPVPESSILGGSLVVAYLTGAVQLGVLILAGKYLFGMDWGKSMAGVLLVAGAFVFAVTCMGLLLSGIVKTDSQLGAVTPVILTSTAMLGGCMWPLEIVSSKALLFLANLTPQKWAMQGMEAIASYGKGFEAALLPAAVLIGMGLIFFAAGVRLVRFR